MMGGIITIYIIGIVVAGFAIPKDYDNVKKSEGFLIIFWPIVFIKESLIVLFNYIFKSKIK